MKTLSFPRWLLKGSLLLGALLPMATLAEVIKNSDPNTLWIEDGVGITLGGDSPWTGNLELQPLDEGGFEVISSHDGQDRLYAHLPRPSGASAYLSWEIIHVEKGEGYHAFVLNFPEMLLQMVTEPQTGIFSVPVDAMDAEAPQLFSIYLYNTKIGFKYLKLEEKPKDFIRISSPSIEAKKQVELHEELTFEVTLEEPAEAVTLSFLHSYMMPQLRINGEQQLELKPVERNPRLWRGSIKVNSVEGHHLDEQKRGSQFAPGTFLVKATILGGSLHVPIWTTNTQEYRFNPTR